MERTKEILDIYYIVRQHDFKKQMEKDIEEEKCVDVKRAETLSKGNPPTHVLTNFVV